MDPILYGEYPPEMREILGLRLPTFSLEEKKKLQSRLDFIGVNHYSTLYAKDCMFSPCNLDTSEGDMFAILTGFRGGLPIGSPVRK